MLWVIQYHRMIDAIVAHCPAPDKFAHTYAGLLIWLGTALVARRSLGSLMPITVVVLAETVNEALDWIYYGRLMVADSLGDMAATWFWPLVIVTVLRLKMVAVR